MLDFVIVMLLLRLLQMLLQNTLKLRYEYIMIWLCTVTHHLLLLLLLLSSGQVVPSKNCGLLQAHILLLWSSLSVPAWDLRRLIQTKSTIASLLNDIFLIEAQLVSTRFIENVLQNLFWEGLLHAGWDFYWEGFLSCLKDSHDVLKSVLDEL